MGSTSSGVPPSSSADQGLTTPDPTVAATADETDGPVTVTRLDPEVAPRVFPRLRKLTDEQALAMTHLYAQTNTPVAEIARTYGIGEPYVYRVAKRHGAALRGRVSRDQGTPPSEVPSMPPGAAAPEPAPASVPGGTQLEAGPQALRGRVQRRFRVRYLVRCDAMSVLKAQSGFQAVLMGANRHTGRMIVASVWETATDRKASMAALQELRQRAPQVAGAETIKTELYKSAFAEVKQAALA
jgi:transposase-like protein